MITNELRTQIDTFKKTTEQFINGEISVKDYKGFSGKFGSYAQRGAKLGMLRLRMAGGRLSKQSLKAILDICDKYNIVHMHCTTCQTIQLHDIPLNIIADVMSDAVENGFYTFGGGGDFPRNVMVSPLSSIEENEYFDVFPYAEKAAEYLISQIDEVKMPRKLKVCFSNSPKNAVHATFRDLGFIARADGNFDVYCAGGMGANPRMGIKVVEGLNGSKILYCVKAMIELFCQYGNYENRAKARTRYMQDVLGDNFKTEYNAKLEKAFSNGGLDINVTPSAITKKGIKTSIISNRIIEQKQQGLYSVKFHPIGGQLTPDMLKTIYNTIENMEDVSVRIAPDETIYIINCSGNELHAVLSATAFGASTAIEESVACIGSSICQQGLRDSQELLRSILSAVKPYNFAYNTLPVLHISGCTSSCGTHQIGSIGFHGKVKMIDKKPVPGFVIHLNGCDNQGKEKFGDEYGIIASDDIPKFIVELGQSVTAANMGYSQYAKEKYDELTALIEKYI